MNIEVQFRAETQAELEQKMAGMLRRCGWQVDKGLDWLRPCEVRARFRITDASKLSMQLRRYRGTFPSHKSKKGRYLELQLTTKLEEYLTRLNG